MYRVKHRLSGHAKPPQRLLVSQAGDLLISSSNDLTIRIWSAASGALLHTIADFDSGAHQAILAWDLSPSGDYLATGMADLTTKVYSTRRGERLERLSKVKRERFNAAEHVRFSPDGSQLACAMGKKIECFRVGNWEKTNELAGHTSKVHLLAYASAGRTIVGAGGKFIKIWDAASGAELASIQAHAKTIGALAVASNGSWFATGGEDHQIRIWSLPDASPIASYDGHASQVFQLAISPNGKIIASGDYRNNVLLWTVDNQQLIASRKRAPSAELCFSPDGKTLVISEFGHKTVLLDAETGRETAKLAESADIAFAPNGAWLASADGNDVVIWEPSH